MMTSRWLCTLASVLLLACAGPTTPLAPVAYTLQEAADSIAVRIGGTATIDRILLTFHDVPAESRCPIGVQCVWEGDAVVRLGVTLACTRSEPACAVPELMVDLHTRLQPQATVYAGMEIRLIALRPVPDISRPVRKAQYVAWFRVRPLSG